MGEEPERLRARQIEGIRHAWGGELTARTDEALTRGDTWERTYWTSEKQAAEERAECERLAGRVAAAKESLPDGALVMRCASGVASTDEGHALIGAFQGVRAALDVGGSE